MKTSPVSLPAVILSTDIPGSRIQVQGDCACPTWRFDESSTSESLDLPLEKSLFQAPSKSLAIGSDAYILFRCDRPNQLAVLNADALSVWDQFRAPKSAIKASESSKSALPQDLALPIIRKFWEGGFLAATPASPSAKSVSDELIAWLHLTDRCNLQCTYCYLPHVREDMSDVTGKAAIEAIFRSACIHRYGRVKLKYAGGEPLLRFALIEQLQAHAQRLANKGQIQLESVVLTNGTLLNTETVEAMQNFNLKLMISLDGLDSAHDNQRMYANGKTTFHQVVAGIELAKNMNLVPHISVTVTGRNAHGLSNLLQWLLKEELPFSINFYRENDLSTNHRDLQIEEQNLIKNMLAAFNVIENNLPQYNLLNSLVDRANLSVPHQHTCGVGYNYMVFDGKGRIAQCQMQMQHASTTVDDFDPLSAVRSDIHGITNPPVHEKQGCQACDWKYVCTGGCPLATYRATGRYDVQSPNCNIYRALLPEVIRLEGLRIQNAYKMAKAQNLHDY